MLKEEHYQLLSARERIHLVLAATARGDGREEQRLRASCPRVTVTMNDPEVVEALAELDRFVLALILELTPILARLDVIAWLTEPQANQELSVIAALDDTARELFLDGYASGRWSAGVEPFSGDDERYVLENWTSDPRIGLPSRALEAISAGSAVRAKSVLAAFYAWATAATIDADALLAWVAPAGVLEHLARHDARIASAVADDDLVESWLRVMVAAVPPQSFSPAGTVKEIARPDAP